MIGNVVQGWYMSTLNDFLYSSMMGIIEVFGGFINNIFATVWEVNEKLNFDRITKYSVRLALAYVVLKAVKQGLDVYVFETEGDPDSDPLELITRSFQASAVIYCGTYVVDILIKVSGIITNDIVQLVPQASKINDMTYKNNFNSLLDLFYNNSLYKTKAVGFVLTVLLCFMLIATIIFIFHAGKRGAELTLFKILLPLMATDLLTASREKWKQFSSELAICIFGYILQIASFNIFLVLLATSVAEISKTYSSLFAALGWLILVISAPKWLSKFMYSSGVGNGAKGGARSAAFVIPQMMK